MNRDRLAVLQQVLPRWEVDLENGIVKTKHGVARSLLNNGYLVVSTYYNKKNYQFSIHEVIAVAGGLDILDKTVDHVNGNKRDNRLSNLEAVSREVNHKRAVALGLMAKGTTNAQAKLTDDKVRIIKKLLLEGTISQVEIAKMFEVSETVVTNIKLGKSWTHV